MKCPHCNDDMFYRDDQNYYVCPKCLGEWWPIEKERGEYQTTAKKDSMFYFGLAEQTNDINSKPVLPPGVPSFKGGSKNGKCRKKSKKKFIKEVGYYK